MNVARDGFPMTGPGVSSHGNHVAHPESAVPPPHGADSLDACTPAWESAWIDLGGEG